MNKNRIIKKVAVLGAGVMGAQIAAHLINSRVEVVLYDLPAKEGDKSAIANKAIKQLAKLKPAPLANNAWAGRITPANYDDDLQQLQDCDLIIEAIAEKMEWKKQLYDTIEPHVNDHAILASNTSGLSINELSTVLNQRLRQRFLGIHFFNPPRYMHLLEIIPCKNTDAAVVTALEAFCVTALGKGVVIAKDTPNFIGNRIGVFSLLAIMHHAERLAIPFEVVDQITGKPMGRPKSGTFRTADVVGLDTLGHVINTLKVNLNDDPWQGLYQVPAYIATMVEQGALGQKTRKGVYINKGKQVFNPAVNNYVDADGAISDEVAAILRNRDWGEKVSLLRASEDAQAKFIWSSLCDLFHYCIVTLTDIATTARDVDFAIRWGFGWSQGPFEIMQAIGWSDIVGIVREELSAENLLASTQLPGWVNDISDIHTAGGSY